MQAAGSKKIKLAVKMMRSGKVRVDRFLSTARQQKEGTFSSVIGTIGLLCLVQGLCVKKHEKHLQVMCPKISAR